MTPPFFAHFRGHTTQFTPPAPRRVAPQTAAVRRFGGRFFGGRGGKLGGMTPKMSKKGGGHFGTQPLKTPVPLLRIFCSFTSFRFLGASFRFLLLFFLFFTYLPFLALSFSLPHLLSLSFTFFHFPSLSFTFFFCPSLSVAFCCSLIFPCRLSNSSFSNPELDNPRKKLRF